MRPARAGKSRQECVCVYVVSSLSACLEMLTDQHYSCVYIFFLAKEFNGHFLYQESQSYSIYTVLLINLFKNIFTLMFYNMLPSIHLNNKDVRKD